MGAKNTEEYYNKARMWKLFKRIIVPLMFCAIIEIPLMIFRYMALYGYVEYISI